MTYGSFYEITNNLSTIAGQHMIEYFTGNSLDSRWSTHGTGGAWAMDDSIGGGLKITSGTGAEAMIDISSSDADKLRPFNQQGCVMITVCKLTQAQYAIMNAAHLAALYYSEGGSYVKSMVQGVTNGSGDDEKFRLVSGEFTNINTDQTGLYDWHTHKLECNTTTTNLSIDGILKATGAGVPTAAVMPRVASAPSEGSVAAVANFRYLECYNT